MTKPARFSHYVTTNAVGLPAKDRYTFRGHGTSCMIFAQGCSFVTATQLRQRNAQSCCLAVLLRERSVG